MPIYDYECKECSRITEHIGAISQVHAICPDCGGHADRIISVGRPTDNVIDAPWLGSVREVVDKEGGAHCQEFLHSPTRKNYQNWMKGEGIRPFEPGERHKPTPFNMEKHVETRTHQIMQKRMKDRRLEI